MGRGVEQRGAKGRGRKPDPMAVCVSFKWKGREKGDGALAAAVVCGGRRPALVAGVAEQKEVGQGKGDAERAYTGT